MMRISAFVVGLFLSSLWIAGLAVHAATWLTWLDGLGALLALLAAVMPTTTPADGPSGRAAVGGLTSLGLFALWIIGVAANAQPWLVWSTFVAAIGMASVALGQARNPKTA